MRDITIAFTTVARTGVRAQAAFDSSQVAATSGQLDAGGRADFTLDIVLRDADGEVVATAVGRYYLRRIDESPAPAQPR